MITLLKGYKIITIYIFLDDANLCVQRVRTRVVKGGHNVPKEDIIRRFYRSKENFWNNFTQLSDKWLMLYNGGDGFQQVAVSLNGKYETINQILFDKFKRI